MAKSDTAGVFLRQTVVLLLFALVSAAAQCAPVQRISAAELLSHTWSGGVITNTAFSPGSDAGVEHAAFLGTIQLTETQMLTRPTALSTPLVLGRDPKLFPGVAISFFSDRGDLVPFTQEVIRYGSGKSGRSYWDILVQPGRVWSEPNDGGWSRAGFPFALVNSLEGETHNGLATFLYKDGRISNLRFQIVQQTAPYYVKDNFVASGLVAANFAPAATGQLSSFKRVYEEDRRDARQCAARHVSAGDDVSDRQRRQACRERARAGGEQPACAVQSLLERRIGASAGPGADGCVFGRRGPGSRCRSHCHPHTWWDR